MDYKMTDADISKALKEESYLDEGHETCGGGANETLTPGGLPPGSVQDDWTPLPAEETSDP